MSVSYKCIGTYHKTGTIWLSSVFQKIAKFTGQRFFKRYKEDVYSFDYAIVFDDHSLFSDDFLESENVRVMHVIRDPRNMLLSSTHYHMRAPNSRERWLHISRKGLGGKSYQQHLCSLPTFEDQLKFEMQNSHRANMNLMIRWDYCRDNCIEVSYEDLINDINGELFAECLFSLGFGDQRVIEFGRKSFLEAHKYVGLNNEVALENHIRESETAWQNEFSKGFAKFYCDVWGDALIKLGYEDSKDWVDNVD